MRQGWWYLLLCGVLVAGVQCGGEGGSQADAATPPALRRIPVDSYVVERQRFADVIQATGLLEPAADITLTAEVPGRVQFVADPVGAELSADASVVELDPTDMELALRQAEAAVASARAAHEKAREDSETDATLHREGLAPQKRASAQRFAERISEARIREAEAARDLAARQLEKTRIRAPMRVVLSERYVEVGEWVSPGTPVARVVAIDALKAVVHLSERAVARVEPGQEAWIAVDTFGDERFSGIVHSVSPTAAPATRTFRTEVLLPNNGGPQLLPGMAARVGLVTRTIPDALVVPLDAVAQGENGPRVFRLQDKAEGPIAVAEPVTLGMQVERRVQLLDGPPPGTKIAASSVELLADGRPVRVVRSGQAP